jgi:hypothetical protein
MKHCKNGFLLLRRRNDKQERCHFEGSMTEKSVDLKNGKQNMMLLRGRFLLSSK